LLILIERHWDDIAAYRKPETKMSFGPHAKVRMTQFLFGGGSEMCVKHPCVPRGFVGPDNVTAVAVRYIGVQNRCARGFAEASS
jgi:hypothetical protein